MTFNSILSALIMALYALGSIGTFWGIPGKHRKIQVLGRLLTFLGLTLHTLLIINIVLATPTTDLSRGHYVQILAWIILAAYFVGWRILKSSFLAMSAAPLSFLLFVLAYKINNVQVELPATLKELFVVLHVGALYGSLGLLTLAFGAGLLFLRLDNKLKSKSKISDFERELPALGVYDRVNHTAVVFGFPLYTIGIAAGFIWAPMVWQDSLLRSWDPKQVFSIFVWFLYASTFYLRLLRGWRGRKAALMIILIFAISVFSLLVVNMFMSTQHSFNL